MKIFLLFVTLNFLLFLPSCKDKSTIKKEKFADIYVEILVAQEKYKGNFAKIDSSRKSIYEKYNITGEEYQSTLESYGTDQKEWDEFFELVNKRVDELQKKK